MSQEQPQRPRSYGGEGEGGQMMMMMMTEEQEQQQQHLLQQQQQQQQQQKQQERPVTYGDVFPGARGEIASEPVKPKDASLMQSVETTGLGQAMKGGTAARMQSAAAHNVNAGLVGKDDSGAEAMAPAQNPLPSPAPSPSPSPSPAQQQVDQPEKPVTYGNVFSGVPAELASEPIKPRDAASMQSVETVGLGRVVKGGPAAAMQSAAAHNVNAGLVDVNSQTTTTPARTQEQQEQEQLQEQEQIRPVTYGNVFSGVQGELASEPIKPKDASLMQSVETMGLGQVMKGGPAATMQSASAYNVNAGIVGPDSPATPSIADAGVSVTETFHTGGDVVRSEYVAGQPVSRSIEPVPVPPPVASAQDAVTIGEALEAAAVGAGDKAIEPSDARAIQSAEMHATGSPVSGGGSLAAIAQSAADVKPRVEDQAKTTLGDVLTDASLKLAMDKAVTREDAEKVEDVERRIRAAADFNEDIGATKAAVCIQQLNVNVDDPMAQ